MSAAANEAGRVNQIEGIQYLRGIAALLVVAHHASEIFPSAAGWFGFGWVGVDVFFVISGFVMAHSTRGFAAGVAVWPQALEFLTKRFVRVVPLYLIALLWTGKVLLWKGQADLGFWLDFVFIPHLHVTGQIWPNLIVGWTINYEMMFYVAFAASMLAGSRRYLAISGALVLLAAAGLAYRGDAAWVRFYTSSLVIEFLLGIGVWAAVQKARLTPPRWALMLALVAASVGAATAGHWPAARGFVLGPIAAVIVWSTVLLSRGTDLTWLHRLGDASYSIYLFHFAAFGLVRQTLTLLGWTTQTPVPTVVAVLGPVVIGVGAGLALHRYLEQPLQAWLKRSSRAGRRSAAQVP